MSRLVGATIGVAFFLILREALLELSAADSVMMLIIYAVVGALLFSKRVD